MSAVRISAPAQARPDALGRSVSEVRGRLMGRVLSWARTGVEFGWAGLQVARERRALLGMDARMLRDLGISCAIAEHEARRPFVERLQEIRRLRRAP